MRKILLSSMLTASAVFGGYAAESNFGYFMGDTQNNLTANGAYWYAQAILVPANVQQAYGDGAELTGITFAVGPVTGTTEVTVFITEDIDVDPFYTQTGYFEPSKFNTITFDTPLKLEGKDLCIGYRVKAGASDDAPIAVDQCGYDFPGSYMSIGNTAEDLTSYWYIPSGFGNNMINAIITTPGDVNAFVYPLASQMKTFAKAGEPMNPSVLVRNFGNTDVTSLTVNAKIGDELAQEINFEVEPIAPGAFATVTPEGLVPNDITPEVEVSLDFVGVNGVTNTFSPAIITQNVEILEDFYNRVCVIEEGTGTNCGFCPRGYVAMETLNEEYTDGSFIGIAAHTYDSRDPMYCAGYRNIASSIYGSNYPCASVNRTGKIDMNLGDCETGYRAISNTYSFQKIAFDRVYYVAEDYSQLGVTCTFSSLKNIDENNYGIAIVTTENNVGPYGQANYYAGNRYGAMGGFETKASTVSLMFNDVARQIVDWRGNADVLPTSIVAGEDVVSEEQRVAVDDMINKENGFVIALLINKSTGEIETAARVALPAAVPENVDLSGVSAIATEEGDATFYTLDGIRLNESTLAPGLYIKRQGDKATKILVK